MRIAIFKPEINKEHKYAVAVPTEKKTMAILKTYETLEQLKKGLKEWRDYASKGRLTKPYLIELLDESGKCRILEDLLQPKLNSD